MGGRRRWARKSNLKAKNMIISRGALESPGKRERTEQLGFSLLFSFSSSSRNSLKWAWNVFVLQITFTNIDGNREEEKHPSVLLQHVYIGVFSGHPEHSLCRPWGGGDTIRDRDSIHAKCPSPSLSSAFKTLSGTVTFFTLPHPLTVLCIIWWIIVAKSVKISTNQFFDP